MCTCAQQPQQTDYRIFLSFYKIYCSDLDEMQLVPSALNEFENRKKPTTCYVWETSVHEQSNTKKSTQKIFIITFLQLEKICLSAWWNDGNKPEISEENGNQKQKKAKTNCLFCYFRTCTIAKQGTEIKFFFFIQRTWLIRKRLFATFIQQHKQTVFQDLLFWNSEKISETWFSDLFASSTKRCKEPIGLCSIF